MRVSASYNFFNGDEHLFASIRVLRPSVEHISVVWQEISNAGEPITDQAKYSLTKALAHGLIDDVILFTPDLSKERYENELHKRSIGLDVARRNKATHFLSMDADEFYRPSEFIEARSLILKHGWTSTSVQTFLHLRRPIWRAPDITCCCFLTEIFAHTEMGALDFPHPHIDQTRAMTASVDGHHHYDAGVVAMYHMNLVRRDLMQKLRNSTTRDTQFLSHVASAVSNWTPGQEFHFPNKGKLDLTEVENEFDTYDIVDM